MEKDGEHCQPLPRTESRLLWMGGGLSFTVLLAHLQVLGPGAFLLTCRGPWVHHSPELGLQYPSLLYPPRKGWGPE